MLKKSKNIPGKALRTKTGAKLRGAAKRTKSKIKQIYKSMGGEK